MSDEPTDHPHSKAETGEPYDNGVRVVHTVTNEMGVVRDYWPYKYAGKRSTTFPWCYEVDFTLRGGGTRTGFARSGEVRSASRLARRMLAC